MTKPKESLPKPTGHTTIAQDLDGVPLAEPPIHKSTVGKLPQVAEGDAPHIAQEKLIAQVEVLLLKGVTTVSHISATLGIHGKTAKAYIDRVHFRWAQGSNSSRLRQLKGEAKARLELITHELWVLQSNADSNQVKGACLAQLVQVHDRKMVLDGLTPRALDALNTEVSVSEGKTVDTLISDHARMNTLASMLSSYLDDDVVEAEYTEATDSNA